MVKAKFKIERKCVICGNSFLAPTLESKHCSKSCIQKAYKLRKKELKKNEEFVKIADSIADARDYTTIPEAVAMFAVGKDTLYSYIRLGKIPSINLGIRLIRISKKALGETFRLRSIQRKGDKPLRKLYDMEPESCYTIGEVARKFKLDESTVYLHIRKYAIPTRQIGNFVYVPKYDIDELYKGAVL